MISQCRNSLTSKSICCLSNALGFILWFEFVQRVAECLATGKLSLHRILRVRKARILMRYRESSCRIVHHERDRKNSSLKMDSHLVLTKALSGLD